MCPADTQANWEKRMIPRTAIILAAGDGGRIANLIDSPKLLIEYRGKTLLEHHLYGLAEFGVDNFIFVLGWQADTIRTFVRNKCPEMLQNITFVDNPEWETKENGYSAYLGIREVEENSCFLIMGDHVFDYGFLYNCDCVTSVHEPMIDFIDSEMLFMKPEWCTKVL
ncbi:MAG: NTP transferase domain-containing protein, partial [FCB group bacterium]|nr:NTP transferase domain-containing protein [FCB group bacterium]